MPEIAEGSLTFDFPKSFTVQKLDDTAFYRRHFQSFAGGAKSVDILAFDSTKPELWLIEAKDYRQHSRSKTIDLSDEIAEKVLASLVCLCAMRANASGEERTFASLALTKPKLRVILHLEENPQQGVAKKTRPKIVDVELKLKQRLRVIDPHSRVSSLQRLDKVPWTVK
jgi:hypothetical protein